MIANLKETPGNWDIWNRPKNKTKRGATMLIFDEDSRKYYLKKTKILKI